MFQVATGRPQTGFSLFTDFDSSGFFSPHERQEKARIPRFVAAQLGYCGLGITALMVASRSS